MQVFPVGVAQPAVTQPPVAQAMAQPMLAPVGPGAYAAGFAAPAQHVMQAGGGCAPGLQYVPADGSVDPFVILGQLSRVTIKQQIQWAQVIVGFDMPNKYIISDPTTGQDLFVAAERTDGVMGVLGRQVFEGGQRPFNLDVALLTGSHTPPVPFIRLERPFRCTCLCWNRPEMAIFDAIGTKLIGSTLEPFSCCHFRLHIRDDQLEHRLSINHHCCDLSLMCWGCPCGCQETSFEVLDGDRAVGRIVKQFNMAQALGVLTGVNADSDQFTIDFQDVNDPQWKGVLIATAIFLDYCFFTKGGQSAREESVMGRAVQRSPQMADMLGPAARLYES